LAPATNLPTRSATRSARCRASVLGVISQSTRTTSDRTRLTSHSATRSRYRCNASRVAADEATMIATVLTIRMVDRYPFGSRCRRSIVIACGSFCSTRVRNRTRLIDVSDVSADAASAARISATAMLSSAAQRAAGRDQVINDDDIHATDIADHPLFGDDVVFRPAFVDKRDRQVEQPGQVTDALRAADVRRDDHGVR